MSISAALEKLPAGLGAQLADGTLVRSAVKVGMEVVVGGGAGGVL